jgi:predicted nucleic acid-binding protein
VRTFVDTSALYALLDADDENHAAAARWLTGPGSTPTDVLVTHSYVLVESAALVHARLGASAVRDLFDAFVPALTVVFVDDALHGRATAAYLAGLKRRVSFVDRVSFQLIRDTALDRAFAFDRDFAREGFALVP